MYVILGEYEGTLASPAVLTMTCFSLEDEVNNCLQGYSPTVTERLACTLTHPSDLLT